jgi:ATP synthase F1 delta subunit
VLQEAKLDGGKNVEVTSALPLTDDEQTTICQKIANQIGAAASVSFRVDPRILGGLVVRAEDQVIDGSLVGRLETLRTSLR